MRVVDELPFAPPQLYKTAIRLRPVIEPRRAGAALASGSARLRDLATMTGARIRARATSEDPELDTAETSIAAASTSTDGRSPSSWAARRARASVLGRRASNRARRELRLGRYELRETWRDVARIARRWRRRRHGVRVGQEALARYRDLGDHRREALELNALARSYRGRGEYEKAVVCYTQALRIFTRLGNRRGECLSLSNLGLAHTAQGNRAKAVRSYEEALDIARLLGDRQIEGQILANLGTFYNRQGRAHEAREVWKSALELLAPGSSAHRQLSQHLG